MSQIQMCTIAAAVTGKRAEILPCVFSLPKKMRRHVQVVKLIPFELKPAGEKKHYAWSLHDP